MEYVPSDNEIPPVNEPLLREGSMEHLKSRRQKIGDFLRGTLQQAKQLPGQAVGAAEATASLGSALGLMIPSFVSGAIRQEPAGAMLERNMYIPRTESGARHLQGAAEVLKQIPDVGLLPELQPFVGVSRGVGQQLQGAARRAGQAAAPVVAGAAEDVLRRQGLIMDVVKPKGGQFIGGDVPENIDKQLKRLKSGYDPEVALEDVRQMQQQFGDLPRYAEAERTIANQKAVNQWIDRNLSNYVKKEMGTPEDPVRKLAESGVTHIQERYDEPGLTTVIRRKEAGFPEQGMGQSPEARSWENLSDRSIDDYLAGTIQPQIGYVKDWEKLVQELDVLTKQVRERFINDRAERLVRQGETPENAQQYIKDYVAKVNTAELIKELNDPELLKQYSTLRARTNYARSLLDAEYENILRENPWIEKLDPSTRLYTARTENLQFDHIVDVLRDDLNSGRIRPEQLSKVSVADAVRRTYEFDQEMAKKAEQAQAELANKLLQESPFKTYDNGYTWVKLPDPAESKENLKLVQDIGCQGGWCTQNESNALYYGAHAEGNNLYVLMSPDKRVHAQIHVQSPEKPYDYVSEPVLREAVWQWRQRNPSVGSPFTDEQIDQALREAGVPEAPPTISEIKPRANSWQSAMVADQIAKNPDYQPTIQRMLADFVKSTKYPVEYDLQNTGLIKVGSQYMMPDEVESIFRPQINEALNFLETHPRLQSFRDAQKKYEDAQYNRNISATEYHQLENQAGKTISESVPYTYQELKSILTNPENYVDRNESSFEVIDRILRELDKAKKELGVEEKKADGGLVSNTDRIAAELRANGMDEEAAFNRALKLANELQMAQGGEVKMNEGGNLTGPITTPLRTRNRPKGTPERDEAMGEALLQGAANMPYNLLGMPVDLATMLMRPFGYETEAPVGGSDWLKSKATEAGIRPAPPSDPTAQAIYNVADVASGFVNPLPAVRSVGTAVEKAVSKAGDVFGPAITGATEDLLRRQGLMLSAAPSGPKPITQAPASDLGFYDPVYQAALNIQRKQGPGQAFLNELQKSENVNKEFLESSGIAEKLRTTPKITREEVQNLAKGAVPEIQEVVFGVASPEAAKLRRQLSELRDNLIAAKEDFQNSGYLFREIRGDEMINALPEKWQLRYDRIADMQKKYDSLVDQEANLSSAQPTKYGNYQLPGGENYREVLLTMPSASDKGEANWVPGLGRVTTPHPEARQAPAFRSPHWEEPNVVSHIRMNDRTDAEGKKVLFIEELQSDWAQEGRKKGFKGGATLPEGWTVEQVPTYGYRGGPQIGTEFMVFDRTRTQVGFGAPTQEQAIALALGDKGLGVPKAPFVQNTKEWVDLSLKNIIKRAVDEGYDRVAFINGAQSKDRYKLANTVDNIEVANRTNARTGEETKSLYITMLDGKSVQLGVDANGVIDNVRGEIPGEKILGKPLGEVVGKDLANNLMVAPSGSQISGEGLNIGGKGMVKFYDEIVPERVNAILKRFGGGKATMVPIQVREPGAMVVPHGNQWAVQYEDGGFRPVKTKEEAEKIASTQKANQIGFDITPAMRERFQKPIPYKKGGEVKLAGGGRGAGKVLGKAAESATSRAARVAELTSDSGDKALPLRLPRANLPSAVIDAEADRVARQMLGEFVRSEKQGDTTNLAGRSFKEVQRLQELPYTLRETGTIAQETPYTPRVGDIKVSFPGDQTVSNRIVESVGDVPIGTESQGGGKYALGQKHLDEPEFWKSNVDPAMRVQAKVDRLAELYEPERMIGIHTAMGPTSNNFAMHLADATLRAIDWSKVKPRDINTFDQIMVEGVKNPQTGERIPFPDWPGLANPEGALEAMKKNSLMRKHFNDRMKTPKITKPLGLPNGLDIQWAMTEPDIRNMEISMTGLMAGELKPGALVEAAGAPHDTYSHRILGKAIGQQEVLTPFVISFPDAAQHIMSTKRPADFTGTIQKVFPHQLVDDQYVNQYNQYRERIKKLTGKKKGGAVKTKGKVSGLSALRK